LDISFEEQRSGQEQYEAFRQWRTRLESAGALAFQATDVEIAEARGFSIAERPLPAVVVNIKDSVYGRIFTLIHEFTHVLLNRGGVCDVDEGVDNDHEDVEIFCNHVAGATIVPRDLLLRSEDVAGKRGPTTWQDDVLRTLSRTFHASRETILRRLLTFNLATPAHYRDKWRQFIAEYAQRAVQQPEGYAPHHRVQISGAGSLFTQLVVEAFNRERITASGVSDFLSIRVKHLPEIERDLLRRPAWRPGLEKPLSYSLDTSGLLDGWVRYYAPEVFPSLWKQMEAAAADGTIVAVQDVLLELERQDDDVFAWAKRHITFVPLEEEIQASATEILARFPQLVNPRRSRSVAEPFRDRAGSRTGSDRGYRGASQRQFSEAKDPRCVRGVGVKCVPLLGMFKELSWQFWSKRSVARRIRREPLPRDH
jgi:Zn-dependent peptidase ImmA (M78 family)